MKNIKWLVAGLMALMLLSAPVVFADTGPGNDQIECIVEMDNMSFETVQNSLEVVGYAVYSHGEALAANDYNYIKAIEKPNVFAVSRYCCPGGEITSYNDTNTKKMDEGLITYLRAYLGGHIFSYCREDKA